MSRYDSGSSNGSCGIGFTELLTIVFIVLKLTGFIDWSWWWVLSPMWISFIILIVVVVGGVWNGYRRDKKLERKIRKKMKHSNPE